MHFKNLDPIKFSQNLTSWPQNKYDHYFKKRRIRHKSGFFIFYNSQVNKRVARLGTTQLITITFYTQLRLVN